MALWIEPTDTAYNEFFLSFINFLLNPFVIFPCQLGQIFNSFNIDVLMIFIVSIFEGR